MIAKRLLLFFLICSMLFSFVSCSGEGNTKSDPPKSEEEGQDNDTTNNEESDIDESNVKALYPVNERVVLTSDSVKDWWNTYDWRVTDSYIYKTGKDTYYPNPVTFSWENKLDMGENDYFKVYISQNKDMSNSTVYDTNKNEFAIDYLYTGTLYYWRVDAIMENGERVEKSNVSWFVTATGPRCLKIDGVRNFRDIGGIAVDGGYRIKQGMVYRSGELETATDESIRFLRKTLKIETDLDLRKSGEGGAGKGISPIAVYINYININGRYYLDDVYGINSDEGKAIFAEEIRVFANPDNYPILTHCSYGRDRTGTLMFVLEAVLGADKNALLRDYELSVFTEYGLAGNGADVIRETYDYIYSFEGDTFKEKAENYLLSIGITAEEIQLIRNNLLEKAE